MNQLTSTPFHGFDLRQRVASLTGFEFSKTALPLLREL